MKATAQFIGRIASVKYEVLNNTTTGRETPRLTLQIITSKLIKTNDVWEERTSSFFVSVWNKLATTLHAKKTLEKGFLVELTTEISTRNSTDQYGNTSYYTDFNLESFLVIQKPQSWFEARKASSNQSPQEQYASLPNNQQQQSNQQYNPAGDYYDPQASESRSQMSVQPVDDDIPF